MPLLSILFVVYLGVASLLALRNWRWGPLLIVAAAALQDPLRKVHPGAPAWFTLSIAPIFTAMVLGAMQHIPDWWSRFRWYERPVAKAIVAFAAGMVVPIAIDFQYGIVGFKLALMGGFFYGTALANIVLGFYYGYQPAQLRRLLAFHAIVTAVMLIGVPLESHNVFPDWLAVGTKAMGNIWIRYIPGRQVRMLCGFYRSPDVMGWHATVMVISALMLALISRGFLVRLFWMALAGWGTMGTFLCGRRKFFYMLPVFALTVLWLNRRQLGRFAPGAVLVGLLAGGAFLVVYERVGPSEDVEVYYFATAGETVDRMKAHSWDTLVATFMDPTHGGLLGLGLGAASTGGHLVESAGKPRAWQEGGLGRLGVELGVPGFLCALFLVWTMVRRMFRVSGILSRSQDPDAKLFVGVFALAIANGASFVVSGQVFGDPFVGFYYSLLLGSVLAGELALEPVSEVPPDSQPAAPLRQPGGRGAPFSAGGG
jgi:hypothetical protein